MKCPHCGKDIPERLVVSEAVRVQRRKAKKILTTEEARRIANLRWTKNPASK